ncbi:PREDICTED: uncharacterized protein LOC109232117 isoform X2 [Nicotiana attenuata]|uniref:uncharacterized protein LOC109232117 isoform X2 n=1 Tax=Nicotiana attenuata TaxID=49451 RepID=UPI000904A492|nr:PREDICTED: uncharacterized protein LOC109232117 isoform X2 [Nicotiana attenuata]
MLVCCVRDLLSFPCLNFDRYYGVLMAYSSLLDFLTEQKPRFVDTLVRTRVLPLYETSIPQPYLITSANWVLGELASCLSDGMSADIYSSLVKALTMSDIRGVSCYPVRVTAAAAIAQLVENEYMPPEWLPLLQVVCHRIGDEEEDNSIYFQLLSTMVEAGNEKIAPHIPDIVCLLVREISKKLPLDLEPWPQGFASLAVMAQCWEDSASEENEQDGSSQLWRSGQATMMRAFSDLLQHAWLRSALRMLKIDKSSISSHACQSALRSDRTSISSETFSFKRSSISVIPCKMKPSNVEQSSTHDAGGTEKATSGS